MEVCFWKFEVSPSSSIVSENSEVCIEVEIQNGAMELEKELHKKQLKQLQSI